ncbi:MAG: hypothetical protein V7704_20750 [Aurantimonas endophytica]|uniref:hypothetical protein n=1 Tax=Aurantimonas endophytica TaxID=1522175 RepID=UPI003002104B
MSKRTPANDLRPALRIRRSPDVARTLEARGFDTAFRQPFHGKGQDEGARSLAPLVSLQCARCVGTTDAKEGCSLGQAFAGLAAPFGEGEV